MQAQLTHATLAVPQGCSYDLGYEYALGLPLSPTHAGLMHGPFLHHPEQFQYGLPLLPFGLGAYQMWTPQAYRRPHFPWTSAARTNPHGDNISERAC